MVVRGKRSWKGGCSSTTFSALSVEPYGGSSCHVILRSVNANFQCSLCRAVWWFAYRRRRGSRSLPSFSALSVEPYGGSAGVLVVFYAINDLKALFEASQGRLRPPFCWHGAIRQLLQRRFSQYSHCRKRLPVCEGGFLSFFSGHSATGR